MTLAEITEACRKLRLRKTPVRFRPRLTYLVETTHGYIHPGREGFTSGQWTWLDSSLHFQCHKDAAEYARSRPRSEKAKVLKLNVCAFLEPIIRSNP